jgi:hypothetical protein
LKAELGHQPLDGAARHRDTLPVQLPPDGLGQFPRSAGVAS